MIYYIILSLIFDMSDIANTVRMMSLVFINNLFDTNIDSDTSNFAINITLSTLGVFGHCGDYACLFVTWEL